MHFPKKELFLVFPYLGISRLCLRTHLQKSINRNISFCKIKIIFQLSRWLANSFRFKDMIPLCLCSNILYNFACDRCNATYYSKTCRQFKDKVNEHSGISPLTNKRSKLKKTQRLLRTICWCAANQFLLTILKCLLLVSLSSI